MPSLAFNDYYQHTVSIFYAIKAASPFAVGFYVSACVLIIYILFSLFSDKSDAVSHISKTHKKHQREALQALNKMRTFNTFEQKERYLKKISPFVFEDFILSAYLRAGYKIKRNAKKTGDGGIDGRVRIKGKWHLIQAKRYQVSYIKMSDIERFNKLCKQQNTQGVFVFVGKISESSLVKSNKMENVTLLYGDELNQVLN